MDRRFVSFFFNRSGHGEGGDDAATKFVNSQTDNPYAYFAAFKPTGELVGETEIYADKHAVMAWLEDLLRRYPEYAKSTTADDETMAAGGLPAARLAEDLADYPDALARYGKLARTAAADDEVQALLGQMRIYRYQESWPDHETAEKALRAAMHGAADQSLLIDASVERGYRLLADKKFAAARSLLQPLTVDAKASKRLAEAHFSAGRACWFLGDHDWAKFHWCWIVKNLPEDRLYMRARIAAAAQGMPYPNIELAGFDAKVGNIGTHTIVAAVHEAMAVHDLMAPFYADKQFDAVRPASGVEASEVEGAEAEVAGAAAEAAVIAVPAAPPIANGVEASPLLIVSKLRDGNEFVVANNRLVDRLEKIGAPAIPALMAAVDDRAFPGRGYASWALTQVLKAGALKHAEAMVVLRRARGDENRYVAALTRSGLSTLPK